MAMPNNTRLSGQAMCLAIHCERTHLNLSLHCDGKEYDEVHDKYGPEDRYI